MPPPPVERRRRWLTAIALAGLLPKCLICPSVWLPAALIFGAKRPELCGAVASVPAWPSALAFASSVALVVAWRWRGLLGGSM
jgi:hypothetical protein